MLAPGNYVQWKSRIKRYIDTKPNHELIHHCLKNPPYKFTWADMEIPISEGSPVTRTESQMETYKTVSQDIRDQLNAEAEAVQIILTEIDNDIYSIVDACPNACKMRKAIERNQCDVTNHQSQELKTILYHKLYDILEIRDQLNAEAEAVQIILTRIDNDIYSIVDACPNACEMWKAIERLKQGESINVQDLETNLFWEFGKFTSQDGESLESYYSRSQQATRNRGKAIVNSPRPIYDQEPSMVDDDDDDEMSKDKEIDKLIALISLSQRSGNVAGARETVGSSMVQKSRIQCYNCKEYRHVARECQMPKRAKDAAYHREKMLLCKQEEARIQLNTEQADWKDDTNDESDDQALEAHYMYMAKIQEVSPDAVDSGPIFDTKPEQKVQNDDHYDVFAIECQHPEQSGSIHKTYLIEQNAHNMLIESEDMNYDSEQIDQNDEDVDLAKERELLASLIAKLKCEINERKNLNTLLETSNKVLVEKLKSEIADFKNKSLTEANNKLSEENDLLYADFKKSKAELKRRDSIEYASEMELECAKIKLYKTHEDKEIEKVIDLENKVKVLDNIVYKTSQSVQMMNMLNNKCRMSFAKPEFLKKAKQVNPRLYDIGCYNDNLALMLSPESDEVIRLEKESQSKLSDLVRPFDYAKLNSLYDLFVPQRKKSSEQRFFSERSRISHINVQKESVFSKTNNFLGDTDG
nr:hypothetical protein [Tanacetum cinerariifolium]